MEDEKGKLEEEMEETDQLYGPLLPGAGDDVPDLAVAPASETDPVPLEDLVPGQQMTHEVRHAPLLHLLDDGAVSALTGDKMASDNLKSDQLLELSLRLLLNLQFPLV